MNERHFGLTRLLLLVLLTCSARGGYAAGEGWTSDYEAAKKQAADQGKDMLLDFTGSDWCGWCIKLVEEVFSQGAFKEYASDHLVLVELDYPRAKEQSDELKAQNQKLKDMYAIRGYPSIYLTDAEGRPYAKTGYRRGGPESYVTHLEELKQLKIKRDEHLKAAEALQGLDKAKLLHAAMQVLGDEMATQHYGGIIDEIKKLDSNNEAGLKKHYDDIQTAKAQKKVIEQVIYSVEADPNGAVSKLDQLAAAEDTLAPIRQEALALKSRIQLIFLKDKPAAKASLVAAIEADPQSQNAQGLKKALEQVFSDEN